MDPRFIGSRLAIDQYCFSLEKEKIDETIGVFQEKVRKSHLQNETLYQLFSPESKQKWQ